MAFLARFERVRMVTGGIAPLDVRFGKAGSGRGRNRVCFVTIVAPGNCLGILRIMRYESVRNDLLPARRHITGAGGGEFIERSVTIQAGLFGERSRCRGGCLRCSGWGSGLRSGRQCRDFKDDHGHEEQAFEERFDFPSHHYCPSATGLIADYTAFSSTPFLPAM